jgi:hypothetical protein
VTNQNGLAPLSGVKGDLDAITRYETNDVVIDWRQN